MLPRPRVSVVMSVYNGEQYLTQAVMSILGQTYGDFEFIIIDDGSTDETASLLDGYAREDARVRVYHQENRGLIASLNRGCSLARGVYIARMDADDVSVSTRFARQMAYLEAHPQVDVLGTAMRRIDAGGRRLTALRNPVLPGHLRWALIFGCGISHSSVIFRRTVFGQVGGYDPAMAHVEDYDLWCRLSEVARVENLPDILLHYRIHGGSIGGKFLDIQITNSRRITRRMIEVLLGRSVPQEIADCFSPYGHTCAAHIQEASLLLQELLDEYLRRPQLTARERRLVRRDAACRLVSLMRRSDDWRSRFGLLGAIGRIDPVAVPTQIGRWMLARATPLR